MRRSGTPSLRRRRGTGNANNASILRKSLLVLLVIAIVLSLGLCSLFLFSVGTTTTNSTNNGSIPGAHSLFRERQLPTETTIATATAVKKIILQGIPGEDLNAANGPPPLPQTVNMEAYEAPPTQLYPYPLIPVHDDYDAHTQFIPPGGKRYTEYTTGGTPYLVTDDIKAASDAVARSRRVHIQKAMQHAWAGYTQYAYGADEILPQSKRPSNNWGGQGITLIDALDTLWLMDMKEEFWKGRDWVRDHLSHENVGSVSTFETTIRDLGGLLAAYDWSGDSTFLEHALDLGKRLIKAFDNSKTGLPTGKVNLKNGQTGHVGWSGGNTILAEFGSIQIENRYLSKVSGDRQFAEKTEYVFEVLHEMSTPNGLYPYFFSDPGKTPEHQGKDGRPLPHFSNDKLTFGAMGDSVYEYMLKMWLQGGKTEPMYREMYDKAMEGMHNELEQRTTPSGLTYVADKNSNKMDYKMDHLACFLGGLLALGAYTDPLGLDSERAQRDLRTGKALTYTCYQMYARMNTGISPEYIQANAGSDFEIGRGAPHYLLRPEAVESMFILNQLTGDPIYREWGWEIFQAIDKYCKTDIGYGELSNVADVNGVPRDKTESFFFAELLKYLYLLQDPETEVDLLNKHVFNTEAHPMRIFPVIDADLTSKE